MKIGYVVESAGPCGGVRVILEHCNRLAKAGHEVTLFRRAPNESADPRSWFDLRDDVFDHCAGTNKSLFEALKNYDGKKVATWWETAPVVAASGGEGFYLVQDIETSYDNDPVGKSKILQTYNLPLVLLTEAKWVSSQLKNYKYIGIGIDHNTFYKTKDTHQKNSLIYNYRNHYLKNPSLFLKVCEELTDIEITTFGLDAPGVSGISHLGFVANNQLASIYSKSTVFLSTSTHEGFCLPILEAMACGCPVVTTNADANMEFCDDGTNCIVAEPDASSLANAIKKIIDDSDFAKKLSRAGLRTARNYRWSKVIYNLEDAFENSY